MSRKILSFGATAASTVLLATFASAADLPRKTPLAGPAAVVPTAVDWSGFYLGGHVGGGWAQSRATYDDDNDFGPTDFTTGGFVGGLQGGYNWQIGRWVYGFEIDGTWGSLDDQVVDDEGDTHSIETKFFGSARLRSGAAIDNVLIFGTLGIAYVRSEFTVVGDIPSPASQDLNAFGLVSGFGVEYALAPNWSLRGEYLYYAVDEREDIPTLTTDSTVTDFVKMDGVHVARVAANYRFNASPVPVAAPTTNWTGLYAGVHGGYGLSRIIGVYDEGADNGSFDIDPTGGLGGAQLGYNWQSGAWVYGIEADASWSGMQDDRTTDDPTDEELETSLLASGRARIGIASGDKLFYVTGGVGYTRSKLSISDPAAVPSTASRTIDSWGVVLGSGTEWAFAPNWSGRLEGLTYLLDEREDLSGLTSVSDPQDFMRQSTVHVIRLGLNYRFDAP